MNRANYKYHIITYHPFENGYDEKPEEKTLAEAKAAAKKLLFENNPDFKWYEAVYIITNKTIVWVFDEFSKKGRKPYQHEFKEFNFK